MSQISTGEVRGLSEAIQRYGQPLERSYTYQVTRDTFRYWELVRRKRVAEVVIVLRRPHGRYLVHTKDFYPRGVYRLLSGGIKPGEQVEIAVLREALEETGLAIRLERFLGLVRHEFVWQGHSLPFVSCVFLVGEEQGTLHPTDPSEAISGYRDVTLAELSTIADQLEALSPDWADWGRFRATAHRLTAQVLSEAQGGALSA